MHVQNAQARVWPMLKVRHLVAGALLALVWSQSWYIRTIFPKAFFSVPREMPSWYIRGGESSASPPVTCTPIRSEYVADSQAYETNPSTSQHAQIADACEDLRMSDTLGAVFLSCDPGRKEWNVFMGPTANPASRGALWVLDYKTAPDASPVLVPMEGYPDSYDFHPHGMSLFVYDENHARMFVANERAAASTIEVLDLERSHEWRAQYVRTLQHPVGTHMPNALHAVGPHELYVSNSKLVSHRPPPRASYEAAIAAQLGNFLAPWLYVALTYRPLFHIFSFLDDLLGLGYVSHVRFTDDGDVTHSIFAQRISFANGVVVSGEQLYVAATGAAGIYVYDRHKKAASNRRTYVPLPFLPDNLALTVPSEHRTSPGVLAAGHPSLPDMHLYALHSTPARRAPSWVAEVWYNASSSAEHDEAGVPFSSDRAMPRLPYGWHVQTLFQSSGRHAPDVSAATSALWDPTPQGHGAFFVTSLYGPSPLLCKGMYS